MADPSRRVEYSQHLKFRLRVRRIPEELPERIYRQAQERYFDNHTGRHIAILSATYHNRRRLMMIAYDEFDDRIEIVTVHPIKRQQIRGRLRSRRWIYGRENQI
jgi:hypothetical protein